MMRHFPGRPTLASLLGAMQGPSLSAGDKQFHNKNACHARATRGNTMKRSSLILAALLALAPLAAAAQEVRIARQFSMGYLQFNVMEHEKLLEKHAAALGLKDVKIAWTTFN